MQDVRIPSIDSKVATYRGQNIALITSAVELDKSYETYKAEDRDNWFKLRDREEAYVTRVIDRGARVEVCKRVPENLDEFTMVICAGELVYQNVNRAINIRKHSSIPLFIEFCEKSWDDVSERVLRKTIQMKGVPWVTDCLCYLLANSRPPSLIKL